MLFFFLKTSPFFAKNNCNFDQKVPQMLNQAHPRKSFFSSKHAYHYEHFSIFWLILKCDFDPKMCHKWSSPPPSPSKVDFFFSTRAYNIDHFFDFFGQYSRVILIPKCTTNAFCDPKIFSKRRYNKGRTDEKIRNMVMRAV